jgi:Sulfatase-modifying factor enzyme 1/PEGA domain
LKSTGFSYPQTMKKLVNLLFFILLVSALYPKIEVKYFRKLDNDSIATILKQRKDLFSKNYSAIYLQSKIDRYICYADSTLLDRFPIDNQTYCLIVDPATRTLNFRFIKQDVDFPFPVRLERNTNYEMCIEDVETLPTKASQSPNVTINSSPAGATVYFNSRMVGVTPLSTYQMPGKCEWRIHLNGYLSESGVINLTENELKQLDVNLKPNSATLILDSSPEKGAQVYVDGKKTGKITPCTLGQLAVGNHLIEVRKHMYENESKKIKLSSGETQALMIEMNPDFADVIINTEPKSPIYINDYFKSNGYWKGRLKPGKYKVQALNDAISDVETINLVPGQQLNLMLRPTNLKGTLKVTSNPNQAIVKIDGKPVCQTPALLETMRVGRYNVELSILGYAPYAEKVTIYPNKTTVLKAKLFNGRNVNISSIPSGANIYIDGVYKGKTPFRGRMLFGGHTVKVEKSGFDSERLLFLPPVGGETSFQFKVNYAFQNFTDTVKDCIFDMVALRGGVFSMGSESGESAEKPAHTVSVNSFYICSTEVTQELWEKVMGENPSAYIGSKRLPVENITWERAQQFITALNKLTGKKYRLPTEAEWEYAATMVPEEKQQTTWAGVNDDFNLSDYAWFDANSRKKTHQVGLKSPNAHGLYDMSGNVSEWCADWYEDYSKYQQYNPTGGLIGIYKVSRGGSWYRTSRNCRVTFRDLNSPNSKSDNIGLRLVMSQ